MSSYLSTFFEEKAVPITHFELKDKAGMVHMISTDVAIEFIMSHPDIKSWENYIRKLDFANADFVQFLKSVCQFIVGAY